MRTPSQYISRLRNEIKYIRDEFTHIRSELKRGRSWQRIQMAISRGSASASARRIEPTNPNSWEFCGFSQNGEDGIIDYLLSTLKSPNRYFIEIGASNGLENNTSWLAIVKRYSGLMVEGDSQLSHECADILGGLNWGLRIVNLRVTRENVSELIGLSLYNNPDVLALDIDGIDYYVAKEILDRGIRPKLFVVEYNSTFGPTARITVEYKPNFDITTEHPTRLCYGVSISGWKCFFSRYGYEFITVDTNGVNAFFIDPTATKPWLTKSITGVQFEENFAQRLHHRKLWTEQYEMIKDCRLIEIE